MERPPLPRRPPPAGDRDRFVAVATFAVPVEAHLALGRLHADGLEASLTGEHTAGLLSGVGGVRLWVREVDRDRALSLLDPAPRRSTRRSDHFVTGDLDAPRCPRCGSVAVEPDALERPLRALLWLVTGAAARRPDARRRCRACGQGWWER